MNSKVFKTLEYEKIIEQLVNCAGSLLGKELCKNLVPSSDIEEIRTMQHETSLALARTPRARAVPAASTRCATARTRSDASLVSN